MKKNKVSFNFGYNDYKTKIIVFNNHLTIITYNEKEYFIRWIVIKDLIRCKYSIDNSGRNIFHFDTKDKTSIAYPYYSKFQTTINKIIKLVNTKKELLYEKG